jgi:C1A family cysteine protease
MYDDEERPYRYATFVDNLRTITERNLDGNLGTHWVNEFADLSPEEFKARFLGYQPKLSLFGRDELELPATTAKAVDWRGSKYVTKVKDQGQCGSCWAFSATEQIETDVAFATGKLLTLSPQQITSCDKTDGGCNGGNTETAYNYVKKAGGLEAESNYPYTSGKTKKTGTCKATKSDNKATIGGYKTVSSSASSESKMVTQIQKSPMSVCVDANSWQTYHSGVVGKSCKAQLDHCVQAVGYSTSGANDYWIVRNSWGTGWGNNGYIYVQANIDACGIAKDATITTGAKLA